MHDFIFTFKLDNDWSSIEMSQAFTISFYFKDLNPLVPKASPFDE